MVIEKVKRIFGYEVDKIRYRGFGCVLAGILSLSYFYYVPRVLFYYYDCLPWDNLYIMYTLGSYTSHLIAYVFINLCFYFLYTRKWESIEKWKISPGPWPWANQEKYNEDRKKLIKTALFNQIITLPISLAIIGLRVKYITIPQEPDLMTTIKQVIFFILCEDFFFYWSHRMLHLPWFYKKIHKKHHEYQTSISPAAEYAHPFEYIFGNSLPVASGPILYGQSNVHIITWFTWVMFRTCNTAEGHSGYDIPFSPFRFCLFSTSSSFHEFHHYKNVGNYGSFLALWDTILDTGNSFFEYMEKKEKIN